MRHVEWTDRAYSDIQRLYEFLEVFEPSAASSTINALLLAPDRLIDHPRIGEMIGDTAGREVRRLMVGRYELRYQLKDDTIRVLRLFHAREQRL